MTGTRFVDGRRRVGPVESDMNDHSYPQLTRHRKQGQGKINCSSHVSKPMVIYPLVSERD